MSEAGIKYGAVVLFALVATLVLSSLVLRCFPQWGLMDKPKKYGYKRKPVPYSAGIILYFVFLLGAILFLDFDLKLLGVLAGASLLVIVSFIDDLFDLSPVLRLFVQVIVVAMIVGTGSHIYGFSLPLYGWLELGSLGGQVATGIWLLVLINVVNWLDGVPGLATGASGIGLLTIFGLSVVPAIHTLPQEGVIILTLLLGVASLVMTGFSLPKLRYLLGDSGSMFLGLMLGVASVYGGGKVATAALVLFIPIFDAIWSTLRRIWHGRSPFKGDRKHMHHRLQRIGVSESKLVLGYLLFMIVIAAITLLILSTQLKGFLALILVVILLLAAVSLVSLEQRYGSRRSD